MLPADVIAYFETFMDWSSITGETGGVCSFLMVDDNFFDAKSERLYDKERIYNQKK